jgi:hypothetical protein
MGLYDRVYMSGKRISRQQRDIILESARAVGISPGTVVITQGSGSEAGLSAGTHAGITGSADIRVWNIPSEKIVPFCLEMRRRGAGATWPRTRQFGWTRGDHIHSLVGCGDKGDDPNLSASAKRQVAAWEAGRNGLSNNDPDPIARPQVWPIARWSNVGRGKSGPDVRWAQQALNRYMPRRTPLVLDGVWGPATERRWQLAVVKARRSGINLFLFLGMRFGRRVMN